MSTKRIKLNYTEDYDFIILGITSSEKEHRLIWSINNFMGWMLSKTENHKTYHKKSGEEQEFSCFSYTDEFSYINFKIISNKSEKGYLLEELKNIDYFLIINGDFEESPGDGLRQKLRNLETIQGIFKIENEKLKSKDRLL